MTEATGAHHYRGRILILDDDVVTCRLYEALLSHAGYVAESCNNLQTFQEMIMRLSYDAILLDLQLEHERGIDALPIVLKQAPFTKIFVLTSNASIDKAVDCMRRGATGFLQKGAGNDQLLAELAAHLSDHDAPRADGHAKATRYGLIGQSAAIEEVIATVEKLRSVDSTVLILGESGTGKEVVARAIHESSRRGKERFGAINCAAIPEALLESELFGHRKGSFTDAKADRKGIFELCSNGTLLLDEIGDMPLMLQTKLLRVLQERQVSPIGANAPIAIDTRVIAATHRDIFDEARSKRFREDLYYRLSIVIIRIPPLRHRPEDIALLTEHFLTTFNQRFGRDVRMPSHSTLARMVAYDWPGNVRELQNAIERAVVLSTDGELAVDNMFQHLDGNLPPAQEQSHLLDDNVFAMPLTDAKQAFERVYLDHLMRVAAGNISEAARISGRYRADVYRLLNRYGLETSAFR